MTPDITVIMATWNRGQHILPSVRSILAQDHVNFELLVIGDCLTDDTQTHLKAIDDPRLRFFNLEQRWGTQSGPNNAGIAAARAPIVAYCGHDDIWAPHHLSALLQQYQQNPGLDCVSSGLVLYLSNIKRPYRISGVFENFRPFEGQIFTPPTGFSHRIDRSEPLAWSQRHQTGYPVDFLYQKQLAERDCSFGSTRQLTAHKWASGLQYLDYLLTDSDQQTTRLATLLQPGGPTDLEQIIATCKRTGGYMQVKPATWPEVDYSRTGTNDIIRGLKLPDPVQLGSGVELPQGDDPRGQDWFDMKANDEGTRWCGPNIRPRLLLPILHDGPASFEIDIVAMAANGFPKMSLRLNSTEMEFEIVPTYQLGGFSISRLRFQGLLLPDRPSIVQFDLPTDLFASEGAHRRNGFAVGVIRAAPAA